MAFSKQSETSHLLDVDLHQSKEEEQNKERRMSSCSMNDNTYILFFIFTLSSGFTGFQGCFYKHIHHVTQHMTAVFCSPCRLKIRKLIKTIVMKRNMERTGAITRNTSKPEIHSTYGLTVDS